MVEIKGAILILCKHLSLLFDINFKPEYFRLAKYNKSTDNVVSIYFHDSLSFKLITIKILRLKRFGIS